MKLRTNPLGLTIIGTDVGCGKTVVMAGIAGALQEEEIRVRAIKPIVIGKPDDIHEHPFIGTVTHEKLDYPVQFMNTPGSLKSSQVQEAIKTSTSGTDPMLVELPGSSSTPLSFDAGNMWLDTTYLATELAWPVLLVAKYSPDSFEQLALHGSYIKSAGLELIGTATVETEASVQPSAKPNLSWQLALQDKLNAPYLGCLKHSQSINVRRNNQGNLLRTTSDSLDLLPIIKTLTLRVSR